MHNELDKIDILRGRLDISYKEAKEALDAAGGNVVEALINLEGEKADAEERFHDRGQEIWGQLKELLHKGQGYRIKVKKGDKTVLRVPASLGALGLLGVLASSEIALIGALGTAAAMTQKYTLEIERHNDTEDNDDNSSGTNQDT
ncbi:MAG: DUF4342 domain-containing protein [Peptococcaceae bacterium]|nr:DUF4342 domain-containing protein [Candidatus Syntrophopropionicum ammoniitolerans]